MDRRLHRLFPVVMMVVACGDPEIPAALGSCDDGTTLGWADVEPIFTAECTACHSTALEEGERAGAPLFVNFDTVEEARSQALTGWTLVRSGQMPKAGDPLADDDQLVLWEWWSCDGPE